TGNSVDGTYTVAVTSVTSCMPRGYFCQNLVAGDSWTFYKVNGQARLNYGDPNHYHPERDVQECADAFNKIVRISTIRCYSGSITSGFGTVKCVSGTLRIDQKTDWWVSVTSETGVGPGREKEAYVRIKQQTAACPNLSAPIDAVLALKLTYASG